MERGALTFLFVSVFAVCVLFVVVLFWWVVYLFVPFAVGTARPTLCSAHALIQKKIKKSIKNQISIASFGRHFLEDKDSDNKNAEHVHN